LEKISGVVEGGLGKAALFLSLPHYSQYFSHLLGATAFPGTLNARVSQKEAEELASKAKASAGFRLEEKTVGDKKLGGVSCIKASVSNGKMEVECLAVFPDKSTHEKPVLELVAGVNLRQKLLLKDGDEIIVGVLSHA